MTPRPRSRRNAGLPPNLYANNSGTSYRYRRPDTGEWFGMGTDREKAIKAARKLNSILLESNDLVSAVMGGVTMGEFLQTYLHEILPPRELAEETMKLQRIRIRQVTEALGDRPIDSITIRDVAALIEPFGARSANQIRTLLVDVFNHAAARGLVVDNPAAVTIPKIERTITQRHTVEGVRAIREASPPWLQNAIDLALITAQRREDILRMRFDHVRDGYLYVVQAKTRKASDAGWLRLKVTPQLQAVINRCRDDVPSPYLIHRRPDVIRRGQLKTKDHWTQISNDYLTHAFQEIRDSVGVYDHLPVAARPGFHQLRALATNLYERAGKDAQKIAGHTTRKMTRNYIRGHEDVVWTEVEPDLDLSQITG